MKFIINTALDPHFCALFDDEDNVIEKVTWENRRKDGESTWNFLKKYDLSEIDFVGGVSGPGGFSSLRAAAGILNSIAFANKLQVFQIRADKLIQEFLGAHNFEGKFLLNSFGKSVFFVDNNGKLEREEVTLVAEKYKDREVFAELLPEDKKALFKKTAPLPLDNLNQAMIKSLQKETPQKYFLPDYQFSPV